MTTVIEVGSSAVSRSRTWAEALSGSVPEALAREIEVFELQIALRKQGKVEEKLFGETRLRRGAYGQRYDNGQRHDGKKVRNLAYPDVPTKGTHTAWDAPGMQRIKIPYGGMTADQLEALAAVSEEYSDAILHITTRQDIQLHFVHIEDTPDLMRRLAAAGITTREACGNTVRNVTGCPITGVCPTEAFDVTPYAHAMTYFLLGHKDAQDFGRKFKVSFSGCSEEACGLASMHDIGLIAKVRMTGGIEERGFAFYVGGGLGAVPYQAQLLYEFAAEGEILPIAQAVCRVFARLGEKRNRQRARLKFLVGKLGLEEFRKLVEEERASMPPDERWTAYLGDLGIRREEPLPRSERLIQLGSVPPEFRRWRETNVKAQKQPGFSIVTVRAPLGDITADQARSIARIARKYTGDTLRTTVEQNILFRWVHDDYLLAIWRELDAIGLGQAGAGTIVDVTACPGTDTCKLGIASSRGLAAELEKRLASRFQSLDVAARGLRIKISGCFNSCGQHHIADIGLLGVSRKKGMHMVPHFQVVLGGQWLKNAGAYGLAIGAVPARNIPEVVDRIVDYYLHNRTGDETFQDMWKRLGRANVRSILGSLVEMPEYEVAPEFYRDWGDAREYTMADYGEGECAGELVPVTEFGLQASETVVFEAQVDYDKESYETAVAKAYRAMLTAAKALVQAQYIDITDAPEHIVTEFRTRFCDTEMFYDPYAGSRFAMFLLHLHEHGVPTGDRISSKRIIDEAQLFIEAAHGCYERMTRQKIPEEAAS
jgi:sulfite reductase (ferredoxin)